MEMDDQQYGMADLRQYMNGRSMFPPAIPSPPDMVSAHRSLTAAQQYEMVMVGGQASDILPHHHGLHHQAFHSDSTTTNIVRGSGGGGGGASSGGYSVLELDGGGLAGDGGTGRWPRQETLTLLEIRSRLDSKFKEANQKGPLWDEVSRILSEEHGYQRSGKKCREKFENLYKYYKKTKEGKAGRQDGKHYRFFRQLEALYGESTNNNTASASESHLLGSSFGFNNQEPPSQQAPKHSADHSLSLSNSSDFETTSSDDSAAMENDSMGKRKKRSKRGWKAKIKDFIDAQMRNLITKQEAWLDKMMKTIEHKENERMLREEGWRKQEEARIEKEHSFWAKERAWIEARDAALMEALHRLTGKDFIIRPSSSEDNVVGDNEHRGVNENPNDNGSETMTNSWQECEITRLIQLRTSMEARFEQVGCSEIMWEEIAAKMASFGYDHRSPLMCRDKWDSINDYLIKCHKKGKENSSSNCGGYFQGNESICGHQVGGSSAYCDTTDDSRTAGNDHIANSSPPNCSTGQNMNDSCFRYLLGDSDQNLWNNYGIKLTKGNNN